MAKEVTAPRTSILIRTKKNEYSDTKLCNILLLIFSRFRKGKHRTKHDFQSFALLIENPTENLARRDVFIRRLPAALTFLRQHWPCEVVTCHLHRRSWRRRQKGGTKRGNPTRFANFAPLPSARGTLKIGLTYKSVWNNAASAWNVRASASERELGRANKRAIK